MLTASTAKRPKDAARFEPPGRDDASPADRRTPSAEPSILATPPPAADESAPADAAGLTPALVDAIRRVVAETFERLENSLFATLRRRGVFAKGEPSVDGRPDAAELEVALARLRDEHERALEAMRVAHQAEIDKLVVEVAAATRDAINSGRNAR